MQVVERVLGFWEGICDTGTNYYAGSHSGLGLAVGAWV